MDNIDKVLWPDEADNFDPSLCAHIMTNGLYKSIVEMEPFNYEIFDVGGTRSMRKKWFLCMKDLGSLIFVADLNAYCQRVKEDPEAVSHRSRLLVISKLRLTTTSSEPTAGITSRLGKHYGTTVYAEYSHSFVTQQGGPLREDDHPTSNIGLSFRIQRRRRLLESLSIYGELLHPA